jgi:hypothetical protein
MAESGDRRLRSRLLLGRGEDNLNELAHPHAQELATLLLDAGADPNDSQTLYNRHFEENDDHLILLFEYGLGRQSTGPWLKRTGDRSWLGSPSTLLIQELCWARTNCRARRRRAWSLGFDPLQTTRTVQ